ncbi:mCpol domain-containing protein, partial [Escherichia coli]
MVTRRTILSVSCLKNQQHTVYWHAYANATEPKISASYLFNNVDELIKINALVNVATLDISKVLAEYGFEIIFRAADGVAGRIANDSIDL